MATLVLLVGGPASALEPGYELSAGANLARGGETSLQSAGMLEADLALNPQILLGLRGELGVRRADQLRQPFYRAGLSASWRFDRTRWMPRVTAFGAAEFGPTPSPLWVVGAALGLDYWAHPHQGLALGITLGYELEIVSGEERVVLGFRVRFGGPARKAPSARPADGTRSAE